MVLWRWGRLLFKQEEDMKEEGVLLFGGRKGEKGCCDEIEKVAVVKIYQEWKGDSLFSGFWARGQRRCPLDLGLNPKLAGRNILVL